MNDTFALVISFYALFQSLKPKKVMYIPNFDNIVKKVKNHKCLSNYTNVSYFYSYTGSRPKPLIDEYFVYSPPLINFKCTKILILLAFLVFVEIQIGTKNKMFRSLYICASRYD